MSEAHTLPDARDEPGAVEEGAGLALADMYARRGRSVYGLCRMMLRDPHEAEDALQSTFLSAHRALVAGTMPRDEAAWLATIARNECRGRIHERMRRPVAADAAELEAVPDPARTADDLVVDERVGKALAALPTSQREAVVLHDVYGLRAREVGAALGMSIPAVEAVLFRARRQLRTRLRPVGASALALPLGVQEALTVQVPGFAGGMGAGGTVVGAGFLAKILATPTAIKLAAGAAAAVVTTGSVVAVEKNRQPDPTIVPRAVTIEAEGGGGQGASTEGASSPVTTARTSRSDDRMTSERGSGDQSEEGSGRSGTSRGGEGSGSGDGPSTTSGPGGSDDGAGSEASQGSGGGDAAVPATASAPKPGTGDGAKSGSSGSGSDDASSGSSGSDSSGSGESGSGDSGSGGSGKETEPVEPAETEPAEAIGGSETGKTETETTTESSGDGGAGTSEDSSSSSGHSGSGGSGGGSGSGSPVDD